MVQCPICGKSVKELSINRHIDSGCTDLVDDGLPPSTQAPATPRASPSAIFFSTQRPKSHRPVQQAEEGSRTIANTATQSQYDQGLKRQLPATVTAETGHSPHPVKKPKTSNVEKAAPLAERMRPRTLDEVQGQELVGQNGIIRNLIETDRVPSMVLWGQAGTGKTTIARLIAQTAGSRFVEINSASSGVAEVKKIFADARNELSFTGRKTIVFCDEIHRFSKSQQDVFLGPVEAGIITLIGATTENPSFKVINALLSRCRVFTLSKLTEENVMNILKRSLELEPPGSTEAAALLSDELLHYLASFSDGDARTALNLLSLALDLSTQPSMTLAKLKSSLTKTLVYDRAGDQHYDTISAFHKSVRGSDADAALYYLARMLQSGEDPLYIARRMVVIASEDVGLADNSMLPLATAAYSAAEKIGMPECRINLAHCCVALSLAPKSTRSYRALSNASKALAEPGVAGLPVPLHLRNAPGKLMKELGYGKGYKYNPDYADGKVVQDYLPEAIKGRTFLEDHDLGHQIDSDLEDQAEEDGPVARQQGVEAVSAERSVRSSETGSCAPPAQAGVARAGPAANGKHADGAGDQQEDVGDRPAQTAANGTSEDHLEADKDADDVEDDVVYDEHERSSIPDEGDQYLDPDEG